MATESTVCQLEGSAPLLDEWDEQRWTEAVSHSTEGRTCPVQGKEARRAEPEKDIDVPAELEAVRENPQDATVRRADSPLVESKDDPVDALYADGERKERAMESEPHEEQLEGLHTCEEPLIESQNLVDPSCPSSPPLTGLGEECVKKEDFSSLEGEMGDCVVDVGVLSGPSENPAECQNRQECLLTPPLIEPEDGAPESTTEETKAKRVETESEVFKEDVPPTNVDICEFNQVSTDSAKTKIPSLSIEVQKNTNVLFFASQKSSNDCEDTPGSTQPAIPTGKQKVEQLPQGQAEHGPEGPNQEAAQQVLSQSFSPLSTVATVVANQNAEGFQGFACVVAVREGQRRAEEKKDIETCQVEPKAEEKESRLASEESTNRRGSQEMVQCSLIEESLDRIVEKCGSLSISKHSSGDRMDSDPYDDSQSDSGVSADFSTSSTFESPITKVNMDVSSPPAHETPIEREIRRAVEREQSLRRSRGLKSLSPTTEYVEIPLKKPILISGLLLRSEESQSKDRQFAGKKMQKEIHTEVQREQALVELGKVPGIYDKGTVRQLKERKQLFEAFQEPRDSACNLTPKNKAPSWASAGDLSTQGNQEDVSSLAPPPGGLFAERRRSADMLNRTHCPTSGSIKGGGSTVTFPRGPGLSEETGCQVIILENNLPAPSLQAPQPPHLTYRSHQLTQTQAVTVVDTGTQNTSSIGEGDFQGRTGRMEGEEEEEEEEEEEPLPRENPFFKLRPSSSVDKVEQDIRASRERERELRRQRSSLYGAAGAGREEGSRGWRGGGGGGGGGGGQSSLCSSLNQPASPNQPLPPDGRVTGPPAACQSLGKLGKWPPSQAEEKQDNQLETSLRPRSPRQKTPLLQHWESGLLNGHREEDH